MEVELAFRALADETRRRMVSLLRRHELSVTELVEILQQPQPSVSRHLKVLRECGILMERRVGKHVLNSAVTGGQSFIPKNGLGDQGISTDGPALADALLRWLDAQPLAASLEPRVREVLARRRETSHEFFGRLGGRWDQLREESFGNTFHLEALLRLIPEYPVVADIGTGTGYLLRVLANHFRHVLAVDPVESMLETARRRVEAWKLTNVTLLSGALDKLPIENGEVDIALAILVLHHVASPIDALREMRRILGIRGRVLIVEQDLHHDAAFQERMKDPIPGIAPKNMAQMLKDVGLPDVRISTLVTAGGIVDAPPLYVATASRQ